MSSLDRDFDELRGRVKHGRELNHASFEPIYYLVFSPEEILTVKRHLPSWVARLQERDGWSVSVFSMAEAIETLHQTSRLRPLWLSADRREPQNWQRTNESLANALVHEKVLQIKLEEFLAEKAQQPNHLVLVTDLEALHPYLRIGAIESGLQGKFQLPTVFLYPGTRSGKTGLRFLGFYPEDGNYRSVHVGG